MRRSFTLAVVAVALVAAGCGGSDSKTTSDGTSNSPSAAASGGAELLASVKTATGATKTDLKLTLTLDGVPAAAGELGALLSQPITITASGVSDVASSAADVDFSITLGAISFAAKILSDGTTTWIQYADQWYALDVADLAGVAGVTGSATTATTPDTAALQNAFGDPSKWLTNATTVGNETVGDIETEHITGTLDIPAILKAVSAVGGDAAGLTTADADMAEIQKAFKDSKVDVWIGKEDHQVHRLTLAMNGDFTGVPDAEGLEGMKIDVDATTLPADALTITPPADPKPSEELFGALFGAFGGLAGGSLPALTTG